MTRALAAVGLVVALAASCAMAPASGAATIAPATTAPTTKGPHDGQMDFGVEGLVFPPVVIVNGHTPRTAQLLGDAYRRNEPLVWKRVQYVSDIGQVAQAAGAPYLIEAMKDAAPQVRAEAARAAATVGEPSLLPHVEKLVGDADANVRREAVLAAGKLAREVEPPSPSSSPPSSPSSPASTAIQRGLDDQQPQVVAAALQAAWTPQHAAVIAKKVPALSKELQVEAATALARLRATDHAEAVLPLTGGGDVIQRLAAVRALGAIGKPGQLDPITKLLQDAHPSVRREAVLAIGKLDPDVTRKPLAVKMLNDADPTVREAAARVLTPVANAEALAAIAAQLDTVYMPLHEAARQALVRPADDATRAATIALAAEMLAHANARRQEDASYILGRLRSDAAVERHLALLKWDPAGAAKSDWSLIAQAAESLGLIGDGRAIEPLMAIVKAAPDALANVQRPQRDHMSRAMANALVAAARLRHRATIADAVRILQLSPDNCPADLRAASAFAIGVLLEPGAAPPDDVDFIAIYNSQFEGRSAKIEAIKALGNLRHAASADRLKEISGADVTPELRWLAHWSYQRCARATVPYAPPTERREPPVSIFDMPKIRQ